LTGNGAVVASLRAMLPDAVYRVNLYVAQFKSGSG